MKEIDVLGVYLPPIFADFAIALVLFAPLKWLLDRMAIERWVWHRPLADLSLFVCILSGVTLVWRGTGWL
jgi:hypothetical protein